MNQQHGRAPVRNACYRRRFEREFARFFDIGRDIGVLGLGFCGPHRKEDSPVMHAVKIDAGFENVGITRQTHGRQKSTVGSAPETERSEEHTSELQSLAYLVCRLLLEK